MKKLILILAIVFFGMLTQSLVSSCSTSVDKSREKDIEYVDSDKSSSKVVESINNDLGIVGTWSSSSARSYGFVEITISKVGKNQYKEISLLIDSSTHTSSLTLNSKGEYHTNNRFGEYYKLSGENLNSYDNQGYLFSLNKQEK